MSSFPDFNINTHWIVSLRGKKNQVDPFRPYAFFVEKEHTSGGYIEEVATVFLTNRECPFKCLMCDLWKNTTDESVPPGAIPTQIEYALNHLPPARHIKLYNSGSFFDPQAIPPEDYEKIAPLLEPFETVIVESHPTFINHNTLSFSKLIKGDLQVALGLETVHPEVLSRLNKKMTLSDFEQSVNFLSSHGIGARAFILLRPPFMTTEEEGIYWAKKSIDFAFRTGIETCIVIPVRSGNGAMEYLEKQNYCKPPDIQSLEKVLEYGIRLKKGIVLADLWDIDNFSSCEKCLQPRKERLNRMNLLQKVVPPVLCSCPT